MRTIDQDLPRIMVMLTNECNLRCSSCNIWYEGIKNPFALKEKQVLAFLRQALERSPVRCLGITGGEPFAEFLSIVHIYQGVSESIQSGRLKHFNITTNGSYPGRVNRFLRTVTLGQRKNVSFNVSLNGLEKVHNQTRGKPVFKAALRTLRVLLQQDIETVINCTISPLNTESLFSVYQLAGALGVSVEYEFATFHNPAYYHYSPGPAGSTFEQPKDWKEQSASQLRRILDDGARFCNQKQVEALLRSLNDDGFERKMCRQCRVPQNLSFVRATGEIYACPYEKPIGSIKDFSWNDFFDARADLVSQVKERGCHGCLSTMGPLHSL